MRIKSQAKLFCGEGNSMPSSMLGHCCSTYQQILVEEAYLDLAIPPKISPVVIHNLVYTMAHFKLVSTLQIPGRLFQVDCVLSYQRRRT